MTEVTRITVILMPEEAAALSMTAQRDYRRPRDQARYLLRMALGLAADPTPEKRDRGAADLEAQRATVAA